MSIISISSDCFGADTEVATSVADRLGHTFLGRGVVREAAHEFGVAESKLLHAIKAPPSVFERFSSSRANHIAFYRAALLGNLRNDNTVCAGFANQCFVREIEHSLKVRLVVDLENRLTTAMEQEGLSRHEAEKALKVKDEADRHWGLRVFGIDPRDPMLYDTVIHVGKMTTEGAIDIVCSLAEQKDFQTTPASQRAVEDLALAARVEVLILDLHLDADVSANDGEVLVQLQSTPRIRGGTSPEFDTHFVDGLERQLLERCLGLTGVKWIKVELAK